VTVGMTLTRVAWALVFVLSLGSLAGTLSVLAGLIFLVRRSFRPDGVRILVACLIGACIGAIAMPIFMFALTGSVRLYDAPSWQFWCAGGAGVVGFPVSVFVGLKIWRRRQRPPAAA
jgi:hypothetical protein